MCGLAGFFRAGGDNADRQATTLSRMADALIHRGPDDGGTWADAQLGLALAHRRLSIVDLSPHGHQPMVSRSGRYVIAFNGEIYNHRVLRGEIDRARPGGQEQQWRGHSDTEVMLAAFELWGVQRALEHFNGMFAFALCDRQERVLYLARDRFGEKPLYYGWSGDTFMFGSELKALKVHPAWRGEVDREAVSLYMRHAYVPAPYSIYSGIQKLRPAHVLRMPLLQARSETSCEAYWSAKAVAQAGTLKPFAGSDAEALESLERSLREAVALRMEADVPLGAFLSGGVDSSLVVALMQAQSMRPVRTFTIGFPEALYNEAQHADRVAKHLGTDHTQLYVSESDAMSVIPLLPRIYDEPFADPSQIPTYLVSRMTRERVTVALSGDGGDELFGGYSRYLWGRYIWRKVGWMNKSVRSGLARALGILPTQAWEKALTLSAPVLPRALRVSLPGDKLKKIIGVLDCDSGEAMYRGLVSFWQPQSVVLGASEPPTSLTNQAHWADLPDLVHRMMFLDQISYLPDDILVKVDRASMAVSLESRVPLLDHTLAQFAWTLPLSMKIRDGQGKWPLLQILQRYVPRQLVERPKMGFGVPLDAWLRGPLRDWAEHLLDAGRLRREGYFDAAVVRRRWDEHLSGRRNWHYQLWIVLMFEAWLEAWQ
jgi:asparagine synthase (glutamine-hydrolysing)